MDSLTNKCARCGEGRLRSWQELTEEEREVTRRLPAYADYTEDERRTRHRWCTRCWHEEIASEDRA
ncbi:MAG: hypothetical protein ICV60_10045 [Pyrinomonadaceae bacterium]|nr:hypothetical protein [Pyrinomonadaceae bacterium]